jgi:hypothetical protein
VVRLRGRQWQQMWHRFALPVCAGQQQWAVVTACVRQRAEAQAPLAVLEALYFCPSVSVPEGSTWPGSLAAAARPLYLAAGQQPLAWPAQRSHLAVTGQAGWLLLPAFRCTAAHASRVACTPPGWRLHRQGAGALPRSARTPAGCPCTPPVWRVHSSALQN